MARASARLDEELPSCERPPEPAWTAVGVFAVLELRPLPREVVVVFAVLVAFVGWVVVGFVTGFVVGVAVAFGKVSLIALVLEAVPSVTAMKQVVEPATHLPS